MKKVIIDYSKLTDEILNLLTEKFPDGYDYDDIISFQNAKNKEVKAVEVRTEDTIFLVKNSFELEDSMESHVSTRDLEEDDKETDDSIEDEIEDIGEQDLDDD